MYVNKRATVSSKQSGADMTSTSSRSSRADAAKDEQSHYRSRCAAVLTASRLPVRLPTCHGLSAQCLADLNISTSISSSCRSSSRASVHYLTSYSIAAARNGSFVSRAKSVLKGCFDSTSSTPAYSVFLCIYTYKGFTKVRSV